MKLLLVFVISFLLFQCLACSNSRHAKTTYYSYATVVDSLPELQKPVLKKLKRFDKNIHQYYVVPFFKAQMDTIPSLELFLSGRFIDHLVFDGLDNPITSPWYFKDLDKDRYLVYAMNSVRETNYQPSVNEIDLMCENKIEMAFSVGAVAGPNIPTFLKTKDDVILCYYDRELEKYNVMTIGEYLQLHPEFIEKMPMPYLKLKSLQNE